MNEPPVRICFVCLGNICRSPTAEGVMRKLVADSNPPFQIEIDSAGTAAYHLARCRHILRPFGVIVSLPDGDNLIIEERGFGGIEYFREPDEFSFSKRVRPPRGFSSLTRRACSIT